MIYLLAFILAIHFTAGILFTVFARRITLWAVTKFGGLDRTEKMTLLLPSPAGKIFLWKLRVRGVFFIMTFLYILVALLAPQVISHVPVFVLLIPLAIGLILTILTLVFGYSDKKRVSS